MENEEYVDPSAALASLDDAAAGYAQAVPGEGWYHVALGLGAGLMVIAQGLTSPWSWILAVAFFGSVPLLVGWWRRSHGWWVSGYVPARTRGVVALMAVALVGLMGASFLAHSVWTSVVLGGVAAIVVTMAGFAWMRVWRRGLAVAEAG